MKYASLIMVLFAKLTFAGMIISESQVVVLSNVYNGHTSMIRVGNNYALPANKEVSLDIQRLLKQIPLNKSQRFQCKVVGFRAIIGANDAGDPIDTLSLHEMSNCQAL